jgi:hypothetical protein
MILRVFNGDILLVLMVICCSDRLEHARNYQYQVNGDLNEC